MLTALALSLSINHAATKAVQNKASLVVGTVFIFMYPKLESTDCARKESCLNVGVSSNVTEAYDDEEFH